jgi:hypothetical protein
LPDLRRPKEEAPQTDGDERGLQLTDVGTAIQRHGEKNRKQR